MTLSELDALELGGNRAVAKKQPTCTLRPETLLRLIALARVGVEDLGSQAVPLSIEAWRPISEATPKPGTYIDVRSVTTYRWLAYKPDGARQMNKAGRWQVCGEYGGWTNAELPDNSEFRPNRPVAAQDPPTQDVAL